MDNVVFGPKYFVCQICDDESCFLTKKSKNIFGFLCTTSFFSNWHFWERTRGKSLESRPLWFRKYFLRKEGFFSYRKYCAAQPWSNAGCASRWERVSFRGGRSAGLGGTAVETSRLSPSQLPFPLAFWHDLSGCDKKLRISNRTAVFKLKLQKKAREHLHSLQTCLSSGNKNAYFFFAKIIKVCFLPVVTNLFAWFLLLY